MPAAPRSLKELFLDALARPAEGRAEWLSQACPDDGLRRQVELMLAAHETPQSLLDQVAPPVDPQATELYTATSVGPGVTIGPYKLLQPLGEGGMGVVYMAEQTRPVERRVALKIIKPGMDTRQVIARFEAERQALALMDHPNIAMVLDAGATGAGHPYFVMELVRGMPITRYCDERRLTPRQRLELLLPVCQAIQHAHQKGIIHRDIKPSNILVTEIDQRPVPKVIDFGVAKAISQKLTEKTMFTGLGQIVGTLEYMSPEQARINELDIDTRSDIYSLGVVLYELLTGSTPFDRYRLRAAGWDEMLRIIREEEPQKPSTRLSSHPAIRAAASRAPDSTEAAAPPPETATLASIAAVRGTEPARLSKLVRGELDWIVMKALEKDRNRRYETANGLAMDLQRYLHDEQVQACPPSAAYRLRKFARRNKAAMATTGLVAVTLVLGIAVSTWQAIRATTAERLTQKHLGAEKRARREAEIARDGEAKQRTISQKNATEAEGQRQRAEANFDKARRAVDEYLTQITDSELLRVPGLQPLREDLLQAALKFYAEFTQERANDPTLQRELASAHYRLALIQREIGNAEASQAEIKEAVRLFEHLQKQGAVGLDLQVGLANAYFFGGRFNDTVTLCQSILQIESDHAETRSLLADSYNELAVYSKEQAQALKYHQQAFALRDALARDFPESPRYLATLGGTVNNLGFILDQQGKLEEALAMYQRAIDYTARAYEREPHSILWGRWLCNELNNVAQTQSRLGQFEEAERSYERLVGVSRKRAFENPAIASLRADLSRAYLASGRHQERMEDAAEASRSFRLAREVLEQIPRETPDQLYELATVYAVLASPSGSTEPNEEETAERQRNADLAMETLKKAVDAGFQNASWLETNRNLDPLRSRDDFQALLVTVQKVAEADRLAKAKVEDEATKLANAQRAAELLRGLGSGKPGDSRHSATVAATLQSVGVIQTGLKQFEEAEKTLNEVLKLRLEVLKETGNRPQARVDELSARAAMGQLYWESGRPQEAHRLWQEVLAQCQQIAEENANDLALQSAIASVERTIGQKYGEIGLWPQVTRSLDRSLAKGQLFDASWDVHSAAVLAAQGRRDEHRQLCRLIADKWGTFVPAQTAWAIAMNPQPVLEGGRLLELAEKVLKSNLDPHWKFKAGAACDRAGQSARAWEVMLAARETALGGDPAFLYWFAMVHHRLHQKEEAARCFNQAEARYVQLAEKCLEMPDQNAVKVALAGSWWAWAEFQASRRLAWLELHGRHDLEDPWQHLIQARAFQLVGEQSHHDTELAATERAWQTFLEVAGHDARPWIHRGRWHAERGEADKADADFTRAAALTPDELNTFIAAGWWAAKTPEGLSRLLSTESETSVLPTSVATALNSQHVEFRFAPEIREADSAHALAYVYSPEPKAVTLLVGGGEPSELRLNGRKIYQWKQRSYHYNLDRVPVLLRSGRNILAARVSNPGRGHGFILRIADNRLDRGLELAQLGAWEEAIPLLKAELANGYLLSAHVWALYGNLLAATGDQSGHREFCQQILRWAGDNPDQDTSLHTADICALAPVPENELERIVKLGEKGSANIPKQGWWPSGVHLRAGRHREVLDRNKGGNWRHAVLRALAWHHLGEPLKARSDLAMAERQFLDILRMGPEGPASAQVSGYAHGLLDVAGSYALLREARSLIAPDAPADDSALAALRAATREQLRAADPRLIPFEVALIHNGKNPERWLQRGLASAELGEWQRAEADFAEAVEMAPGDPEVLASRCLVYADLNRAEEALADLAKLMDEEPDSTKAPLRLAARQRVFDELAQRPELFERVTQRHPGDPALWLARARHHVSRLPLADAVDKVELVAAKAIADLREAVARGFRDFEQFDTEPGWETLRSSQDFQQVLREMAERNPDDLVLVGKFEGHTDVVRAVLVLPDSRRAVSVGRDSTVRQWHIQSGASLQQLQFEGSVGNAHLTADGQLLAFDAGKSTAQVWDVQKGVRLHEFDFAQDSPWFRCVCISPDKHWLFATGKSKRGLLWDLTSGRPLPFEFAKPSDFDGAAFSPDGRVLMVGAVGRVYPFQLETGEVEDEVRLPQNRYVQDLAFAPSGLTLACGQNGGQVNLIDTESGQVIKTLQASEAAVIRLAFLGNERYLLAASDDGALRIWDLVDDSLLSVAVSRKGTCSQLSISPDGRLALSAGGEQWDEATKKLRANGDYALRLWQLPQSVWSKTASDSKLPAP